MIIRCLATRQLDPAGPWSEANLLLLGLAVGEDVEVADDQHQHSQVLPPTLRSCAFVSRFPSFTQSQVT